MMAKLTLSHYHGQTFYPRIPFLEVRWTSLYSATCSNEVCQSLKEVQVTLRLFGDAHWANPVMASVLGG